VFGSNDAWCARVGLQLASQSQDLHIDGAVEDILIHAGCLKEVFAAERLLGCVEKGRQQSIFALGQWNLDTSGIDETPQAPIELPATELAPAPLWIPLRRGAAGVLPPQHGANPRQKLPKAEWLDDIVVGAELQPDHRVDLAASFTSGDDHRDIGARPDLAQLVESVFLAKSQIEDDEMGGRTSAPNNGSAARQVGLCSKIAPPLAKPEGA
jgi:hypothetical protein